jgi:hypothetical protein
MAGQNWQA